MPIIAWGDVLFWQRLGDENLVHQIYILISEQQKYYSRTTEHQLSNQIRILEFIVRLQTPLTYPAFGKTLGIMY